MANSEFLVGTDIGTTSVKAALYRIGGDIEDYEFEDYPTYYPKPGFVEQDADEVLGAVIRVLRALVKKTGVDPSSVSGMVFGGVWQSLIPVDRSGNPLARAMLWADSRSIKQNERLQHELPGDWVKERTGCTIHPMYFLTRLLWYKEEVPEVFKQTYKFISIKEYVLHHLFGEFAVDKSIASGTGIFEMRATDWDTELLHAIGVSPEKFSGVMETTAVLKRGLRKEFASQTGLLKGTPGIIGAADGALSHLGSVGLADDRMSMTVGTGSALRRRLGQPQVLPGSEAWCYYMSENNWLLGGIVHDAGNVMKWFADNFLTDNQTKDKDYDRINKYADEIEPGAEGLVFLPFLSGERCPFYRPDARGAVCGLTFAHGKKHIIRALMEGISYRLYSVYQMLAGESEPELVVTGGLLKSSTWLRITADFFGKKLWIPRIEEASAWGGIIVGLRALGVIDKVEKINDWIEVKGKQDPDLESHEKYQAIKDRYNDFYEKLFRN
jgi:gluconokinase